MKRIGRGIGIGLSVLALVCLTGCWDKMELTERAFIMGVAIDKGENDQVVLTVQMYRPTQMPGGQRSRQREAFFQVKVKGNTVLEAARDIPVKLGRKGQWSHCRVIIIGEDIAREKKVDKVLDFLYRDHEPRLNSAIFVAKGKAADYLEIEPVHRKYDQPTDVAVQPDRFPVRPEDRPYDAA